MPFDVLRSDLNLWEMLALCNRVIVRIATDALHCMDDRRAVGLNQDVAGALLIREPNTVERCLQLGGA